MWFCLLWWVVTVFERIVVSSPSLWRRRAMQKKYCIFHGHGWCGYGTAREGGEAVGNVVEVPSVKMGETVCQPLKWWNSWGRGGCIQAVLSACFTDQGRYMGQGSGSLESIVVIKARWMTMKYSKLNKWLKRGVQHWTGLLVGADRTNKMIKIEWLGCF
jgi:hypothetical protein